MDLLSMLGYGNPSPNPALVSGGKRVGYIGSSAAQRQGTSPIDGAISGIAQFGAPIDSVAKAGGASTPSFMDGLTGWKGTDGVEHTGWGSLALGGAQGLMGLYQGMKQYGMAEDQFEESQRQYNQDYAAQKQITNADMEDRQRARVASNSGAYQSVSDYMAKNGIR